MQKYLEVSNEQVLGAAAALLMLSPVTSNGVNFLNVHLLNSN
ncbi:hypothetical protein [Nostoc sp.]